MNPKINIPNLVRQLLPNHKRLPNIMCLFRAFSSPLASKFEEFDKWRDDIRIEMNMTGQVGVLEGYLRAKYNDRRIRVETSSDHGLPVGLHFEGRENTVKVGRRGEMVSVVVPLPGELAEKFGDADFVVEVSAVYDEATIEKIRIDIARYKMVLVNYKIVKR